MLVLKYIPYILTIFVIDKKNLSNLFIFYLILIINDTRLIHKKFIINYLFLYYINNYNFIEYIKTILFISLFNESLQSIYVFMALTYHFYNDLYLLDNFKSIISLLSICFNVRLQIPFIMHLRGYMIIRLYKIISLRNYMIICEILHNICNCCFLII